MARGARWYQSLRLWDSQSCCSSGAVGTCWGRAPARRTPAGLRGCRMCRRARCAAWCTAAAPSLRGVGAVARGWRTPRPVRRYSRTAGHLSRRVKRLVCSEPAQQIGSFVSHNRATSRLGKSAERVRRDCCLGRLVGLLCSMCRHGRLRGVFPRTSFSGRPRTDRALTRVSPQTPQRAAARC